MTLTRKMKIVICVTLSVLVLGMIFLAVFGLNQTGDYKNTGEIHVSVNVYDEGESGKVIKSAAEDWLKDNKVTVYKSSTKKLDDGNGYIFMTKKGTSIDESALKTKMDDALKNSGYTDAETTVKVYQETLTTNYKAVTGVIVALAIAVAAVLLYLFLVEKFFPALVAVCGALISSLLYVAVISLVRIPAYPSFSINLALTFTVSLVLSAVLVNRFREISKIAGNEGMSADAIVKKGLSQGLERILVVAGAFLLAGVLLAFALNTTMLFTALQVVIACGLAVFVALMWVPFLWTCFNRKK